LLEYLEKNIRKYAREKVRGGGRKEYDGVGMGFGNGVKNVSRKEKVGLMRY